MYCRMGGRSQWGDSFSAKRHFVTGAEMCGGICMWLLIRRFVETQMLEEALYSTASHPADTMAGGQSNAGSIDDRIAALMDQQPDSPDTPLDAQSALSSPSAPPSVWSRSSSSARAFRPDQVRSVYLSFCSPVAGCHPRHRRLSEGGNGSVSQGPDFGMMDGAAFAKICRELSLFGSGPAGKVYSGKADAIFFAVKDQVFPLLHFWEEGAEAGGWR